MAISKKEQEAALRHWQSNVVYLTAEGLDKLRRKLARLKESLPDLISETQRTAAYGDRSDSAEYTDAKRAMRRAQGLILRIEDELKRVEVIETGPSSDGKIRIGSTVTIVAKERGVTKTYQIVGPQEADPANGRISHLSPLGAALIGRKEGETITIQAAGGTKQYGVANVRK